MSAKSHFSTAEVHQTIFSSAAGQKTTPEQNLTLPAAAPASPRGIRSGSPGTSGCRLWLQMPPAAGPEPAPLAYLHG